MDTGHGGTYDPVMPVCAGCGEDNPARASFCLACAAPLTAPAAARRAELGAAVSGAAQARQNLARSGLSSPQRWQTGMARS
jgi:predicted amidophosphoribosyltransferase